MIKMFSNYMYKLIVAFLFYGLCSIISSIQTDENNLLVIFGHNATDCTRAEHAAVSLLRSKPNRQITIHACKSSDVLKAIINAKYKSTIFVYVIGDCKDDAKEIFESPFCWDYKKIETLLLIMCGYRNEESSPNLIKKASKRIILNPRSKPTNYWQLSSIFAEAADEYDRKSRQKHRTTQPKSKLDQSNNEKDDVTDDTEESEISEKNEEIEEIKEKKPEENERKMKTKEKLKCKYRKSCYNNDNQNTRIEDLKIKKIFNAKNFAKPYDTKNLDNNKGEDYIDKNRLRLECKYRYSCYKNNGVSDKLEAVKNKDKKEVIKNILTTKPSSMNTSPNEYQKVASTKEVASDALEKLKKKKESNINKPKFSQAEKILTEVKKQTMSKNACKYRKSCYESGMLPEIEGSFIFQKINNFMPSFSANEDDKQHSRKEKIFNKLTNNEQKLHCKYRKSCYNTGKAPKIEIEEKFDYKDVLKSIPKEVPLKMRCKYRKSCYETGKLPEQLDKRFVEKKSGIPKSAALPTTVNELKVYCKYRKHCYEEMSKQSKQQTKDENEINENLDEVIEKVTGSNNETENIESEIIAEDEEEEIPEEIISKDIEGKKIEEIPEKTDQKDLISEIIEEVPKTSQKMEMKPTKKQKTKSAKIQTTKRIETKKKATKEEFCDNLNANEELKSTIKDNALISKKLKGRQPTGRPNNNEELSDIMVKSSKRHLRKIKKDDNYKIQTENEKGAEQNVNAEEKEDDAEEKHDEREDDVNIDTPIYKAIQENVRKEGEIEAKKNEKDLNANVHFSNNIEATKDNEESTTDDDIKDQIPTKTEASRRYFDKNSKLECKYRKSCYNQLGLSENNQNAEKLNKETIMFRSLPQQKINTAIDLSRIKREEQLKCKYRKSCYDYSHTLPTNEKSHDKIKLAQKDDVHIKQPQQNPHKKHISQNKDNSKQLEVNDLSKDLKSQCKYRHSCYKNISPKYVYSAVARNKSVDIDSITNAEIIDNKRQLVFVLPNGNVCSKYRISCRKEMGLPAKERAPIGPDGRKLCRKKKICLAQPP